MTTFLQACADRFFEAEQAAFTFVQNRLRNITVLLSDPSGLTKIARFTLSGMQIFALRTGGSMPAKLTPVIGSANLHDFYSVFTRPRSVLYPVSYDRLSSLSLAHAYDELAVLHDQHFNNVSIEVIKQATNHFLDDVKRNSLRFQSKDDFLAKLAIKVNARLAAVPNDVENPHPPIQFADNAFVALVSPRFNLVPQTWVQYVMGWTGAAIDAGVVLLCGREWNLIDLSDFESGVVSSVGLSPGAKVLDVALRAGVVFYYCLNIIDEKAGVNLAQSELDKEKSRWRLLTAVSETVYHTTCLAAETGVITPSPYVIPALSILTNLVGIRSILKDKQN